MRKIFILLSLFAFCSNIYSQDVEEGEEIDLVKLHNMYQFPKEEFLSTIPYEDVNGKMIVEVEINGKKLRCLFDTGCAMLTLKSSIVNELGLPFINPGGSIDSQGKMDTANIHLATSFVLGDISISNIPVMKVNKSVFFECLDLDGIVGFDFMGCFACRISSSDKLITITNNPEKLNLKEENSTQLFYSDGARPVIMARFINEYKGEHIDEYFLIDTGADRFVSMPTSIYKERYEMMDFFKFINEQEHYSAIGLFSQFGETEMRSHIQIQELKVINASFRDIDILTGGDSKCKIGSKLLDHGVVTIDNINAKFYYEPFDSIVSMKPKKGSVESSIANGKMTISEIHDEDMKTLLNVGDKVLAIDDYDCSNVSECDVVKGFGTKGKDILIFTVEDKDTKEVKTVEINLNK